MHQLFDIQSIKIHLNLFKNLKTNSNLTLKIFGLLIKIMV